MRAKSLAITSDIPLALIATGACSLEEPQPKFLPATIISPGLTLSTKDLSISSMQCSLRCSGSAEVRYLAGMMTSVSMLSPYLNTLPLTFMANLLVIVRQAYLHALR